MPLRSRASAEGPAYLRVADELEARIARGTTGELLDSENELAHAYDVSRMTARAALEELERRYLVRRSRGRRSSLSQRIEYLVAPDAEPSYSATVRAGGATPRSRTESIRSLRPPADVRARLDIGENERAVRLARLRFVDDEPVAFAESWLAADLVPDLSARLGESASLHAVLRDVYRLEPVRGAVSRGEFVVAPARIAAKLGLEIRPMTFELNGTTDSAARRRCIQVTTSWLRADVFRVIFSLGTRR